MRSFTSATWPSRSRTSIAPSPSTRARYSVMNLRSVATGSAGRRAERLGVCVEGPVHADDVALLDAVPLHPVGQRAGVRRLHGAEAAVAAAVVGRAERSAPGVRQRAQARCPVRAHHTDVAAALALHAHAVGADRR